MLPWLSCTIGIPFSFCGVLTAVIIAGGQPHAQDILISAAPLMLAVWVFATIITILCVVLTKQRHVLVAETIILVLLPVFVVITAAIVGGNAHAEGVWDNLIPYLFGMWFESLLLLIVDLFLTRNKQL